MASSAATPLKADVAEDLMVYRRQVERYRLRQLRHSRADGKQPAEPELQPELQPEPEVQQQPRPQPEPEPEPEPLPV